MFPFDFFLEVGCFSVPSQEFELVLTLAVNVQWQAAWWEAEGRSCLGKLTGETVGPRVFVRIRTFGRDSLVL